MSYYVERAKKLINAFCEREYGSQADFTDPHKVDIAYTTAEDEDGNEYEIQVTVDIVNRNMKYYIDGKLHLTETLGNGADMIMYFDNLDYNMLIADAEAVF
jgi:hypothetical protein